MHTKRCVKTINNLGAILLLILAITYPIVMRADQVEDPLPDPDKLTSQHYINKPVPHTLLDLDDEALQELAELGIDMNDDIEEDLAEANNILTIEEDLTGTNDELAHHIIKYASQYLGKPYRYGARGPSAFDCSGFTSYVFRKYGINLSTSSSAQYTQGRKIRTDEVRPGDLLFFGGRSGNKSVGHVALAVDVDKNGTIKFIHAAIRGGIRYDRYPDGGYYSKRYIGARRVIE